MNRINYQILDENKITEVPANIDISYGVKQDAEIAKVDLESQEVPFDTTGLPIEIEIPDIQALGNEAYAMLRRNGFGGSDSSVLLGVNPYKTLDELIKEKASLTLSEEERAIGLKVAVRKGNDLEPFIISKYERFFGTNTIKPVDMYKFIEYPYLKMNFDGISWAEGKPFPVEIKVATQWGQKHYNPAKAIFSEVTGMFYPLPEDVSEKNWSIETKAAHYGIPPYYYTQIQCEMLALNADYGQLAVLFDKDWFVHVFFIWRDRTVQSDIILNGYKAWRQVIGLRIANGWEDPTGELLKDKYMNQREEVQPINRNLIENIKEEVKHEESRDTQEANV